jgi:hypothetical protein
MFKSCKNIAFNLKIPFEKPGFFLTFSVKVLEKKQINQDEEAYSIFRFGEFLSQKYYILVHLRQISSFIKEN